MKSKTWLIAIAVVSILALAGIAAAFMGKGIDRGAANGIAAGTYHDDMYKVMSEGKYSDFVALREKAGFEIMPWVESEEDFKIAQQMHEKMEKFHEENNFQGMGGMNGMMQGMGRGMMNGNGLGGTGCTMMG